MSGDSSFYSLIKEKYLKEIAQNTSLRPSFQVVLTGTDSRLKSTFILPQTSGCKYEIALVSLETYYSFPNIDEKNNKMKVFTKKSIEVTIPTGWYELKAINNEVKRQVVDKGCG